MKIYQKSLDKQNLTLIIRQIDRQTLSFLLASNFNFINVVERGAPRPTVMPWSGCASFCVGEISAFYLYQRKERILKWETKEGRR